MVKKATEYVALLQVSFLSSILISRRGFRVVLLYHVDLRAIHRTSGQRTALKSKRTLVMLGNQICGAASPLCRAVFVARSGVGSPYGRRASFVRRGQRHRAGNERPPSLVGPKARACRPAAHAHPGSRTTCARADSPIDGVGLNPNERMPPPPPPRPPPPANMCTETKWGKMLRLRSSQRGRTGGRSGAWYRHRHRRRWRRQHRTRARVGSPAQRGVAQVGVRVPPLRPSLRRRRSLDSFAT